MPDIGFHDLLLLGVTVVQGIAVKATFRLVDALNRIRKQLAELTSKVEVCDALREQHQQEARLKDTQIEGRLQNLEKRD